MNIERLNELLCRMRGVRVAVVGDYCVDAYWFIDLSLAGLSAETGKSTFPVGEQVYGLGGAGNIVSNLAALCVERICAVGVACRDIFGTAMFHLLASAGAETSGIVEQPEEWSTPVYGKSFVNGVEQNRMDFGVCNRMLPGTEEKVVRAIEDVLRSVHGIIVNQQLSRGIHSDRVIEGINRCVADFPEKFFIVDSRIMSDRFRNVTYRLNAHEAARLCGAPVPITEEVPLEDAVRFSRQIEERSGRPAFISLGAGGSLVCCAGGVHRVPGIPVGGKIDPVGAGDTAASALACALAAGASPIEAAQLANVAAAVTVTKLRTTGTATPQEIVSMFERNLG